MRRIGAWDSSQRGGSLRASSRRVCVVCVLLLRCCLRFGGPFDRFWNAFLCWGDEFKSRFQVSCFQMLRSLHLMSQYQVCSSVQLAVAI